MLPFVYAAATWKLFCPTTNKLHSLHIYTFLWVYKLRNIRYGSWITLNWYKRTFEIQKANPFVIAVLYIFSAVSYCYVCHQFFFNTANYIIWSSRWHCFEHRDTSFVSTSELILSIETTKRHAHTNRKHQVLRFVGCESLYNLVNKANLMHNLS